VISDDGLILTNDHVCGTQKEGFTVIRPDGKQVGAVALWTTGDEYDLCLIKSEDHATSEYYGQPGIKLDWHPATFATAEPTYGDEVTAIGNPFELEFVVTRGIVSRPNQTVPYAKTKRLQFDAVVGPGNSGGGLWNDKYELIGIVHAGRAVRGVPVGLNFAIPISMVREVLAQ
jgi:serine protease Do